MEWIGNNTTSFYISFCGIGAFPVWERPRILWVGVEDEAYALADLTRKVDRMLMEPHLTGYSKKSNFVPHVTIGRAPKNEKMYLSADLVHDRFRCNSVMEVNCFYLMESILFPSGPVYKPVNKFLFK